MFAELNKKRNKEECKSIHRKQIYGYQRGKGRGGINWEFGINRYTSLYIKQINRDILY